MSLIKFRSFICVVILSSLPLSWGVEWTYGLQGSTARSSEEYDLPLLIPPLDHNITLITGPRLVSKPWARHIVSSGSDVTLNCTLDQPYDIKVSWTRGEDVLSVNNFRYSTNTRLNPTSSEPNSPDQSLRFQALHTSDSGIYLCRVATVPEQVAAIKLVVLDAYSVIFGASDVSVMEGGKLFLLCLVLQVSDVPNYIMWLHDGKIINYNIHPINGSIAKVSMDMETRSSELAILNVQSEDSGIYTCVPSNAEHAEVNVSIYPKKDVIEKKKQICDSCILVLQMGATVAFFCLSFLIAFCVHDYKQKHGQLKEEDEDDDDDDYDPYDPSNMMFQ